MHDGRYQRRSRRQTAGRYYTRRRRQPSDIVTPDTRGSLPPDIPFLSDTHAAVAGYRGRDYSRHCQLIAAWLVEAYRNRPAANKYATHAILLLCDWVRRYDFAAAATIGFATAQLPRPPHFISTRSSCPAPTLLTPG